MELLVFLGIVVGLVYWVRAKGNAVGREASRRQMELVAVNLLAEFPGLDDEQIATVMRDMLQNDGDFDSARLFWASADTVGRVRRTIAIGLAREELRARERALNPESTALKRARKRA